LCVADRFAIEQEGLSFHCPLTVAKRKNLALQMVSRRVLGYAEPALPHILHVGVTTKCNLHCPACPTGNGTLGRPAGHLSFEIYARAVDELLGALMFMLFWDWGEPLMHPRLPDMVEYAGRRGIMTVVSTNGTVANAERQIERLVSAQPSVVIVCVDGADQRTYEKYRTGGKLSRVLDTIRRLRDEKDRQGSPYPVIEFRTLAIRDNEQQMPELLKMAMDTGSDLFSVKSLRPYDYRGTNVDAELVPLEPTMRRYSYGKGGHDAAQRLDFTRLGPLRCGKPHFSPTLNSDGTLAFCSYASYPLEFFGQVADTGFRHLWRSGHSRAIRTRFTRMGGSESCETCFFRSDHAPTILHQVVLRELPPDITAARAESGEQFLAACAAGAGR
jgi:MoaA/NifB/PqqE/SkfB family radical SAM enzyme